MPRQNRVTPNGDIISSAARGTLMGNRGCLHDSHGRIRRAYVTPRWIICLLDFKGVRRNIMTPGRWTELFFLDEATAALDEASEASVYAALLEGLPKASIVSISHRSSLARHHQRLMSIVDGRLAPA